MQEVFLSRQDDNFNVCKCSPVATAGNSGLVLPTFFVPPKFFVPGKFFIKT